MPNYRFRYFFSSSHSSVARAVRFGLVVGLAFLLSSCALPEQNQRSHSTALPALQASQTALGLALQSRLQEHAGLSGIRTLSDPLEAYAARVLLSRAAEKTLDVQYYIWRNDQTGQILLQSLHLAAERGVRVRLLLDDNGISGLDKTLAALDSHPNIEIRLFNPFVWRSPKFLGFLFDFSRLNRRMHNKSFTADNRATIVGGRNVGDEYFGATQDVLFADLDVLAVGEVVGAVSHGFDRYWSSESAYPLSALLGPAKQQDLDRFNAAASSLVHSDAAQLYQQALRKSGLIQQLLLQDLDFIWARTHMISDDPAKALGKASVESLLVWKLDRLLGAPKESVDLVSSYFVPTESGVESFAELAARAGMHINVLTNSLAATDVVAVHAGYAKRRAALLKAGVKLWELKPSERMPVRHGKGPLGSSGSALHAKTFAVDADRVFVGSFNFDPRSVNLNTELGFIIESPQLAKGISQAFIDTVPFRAYEVRLDTKGNLYWLERRKGGEPIRYNAEPRASAWRRISADFLSLLPIEWML